MGWISNVRTGPPTAAGSCSRGTRPTGRTCGSTFSTWGRQAPPRAGSPTARTPSTTGCSRPTGPGCCSWPSRSRGPRGTFERTRPSTRRAPASRRSWATVEKLRTRTGPLVARRPAVRVQLHLRWEPGNLHRRRRHRPDPPDPEPRPRRPPLLVTRRQGRSRSPPTAGGAGARRHRVRRHRVGPPHAESRTRRLSRLLARRRKWSPSSPTAMASSRSTSPVPTVLKGQPVAAPEPRSLSHLDAGWSRGHLRVGSRWGARRVYAGPRAVNQTATAVKVRRQGNRERARTKPGQMRRHARVPCPRFDNRPE